MTSLDYICPRCNYSCNRKNDMSRHLFHRKRICRDPNGSDIELTDEIKQQILLNRIYDPNRQILSSSTVEDNYTLPSIGSKTINQSKSVVINNTQINVEKMVIQMSSIDKLECLLKYGRLELLGCDNTMDKRFEDDVYKFKTAQSNSLGLDGDGLLKKVSQGIKPELPFEFNIHHKSDGISIYCDGEWEHYSETAGVRRMVEFMQSYLFNDYELYLLKKIHSPNCNSEIKMTEHLRLYYNLLISIELNPYVTDCTDKFIMGHVLTDTKDNIIEKYAMGIYTEQEKILKKSHRKEIYQKILKIISDDTTNNIKQLHTAIMNILKIDNDFRTQIIEGHHHFQKPTWTSIVLSNAEQPCIASE